MYKPGDESGGSKWALALVLGLTCLIAAIFIPAFLVNRDAGRDAAARDNMKVLLEGLTDIYRHAGDRAFIPGDLRAELEGYLLATPHRGDAAWADKNPWDLKTPGFSPKIKVVSGMQRAGIEEAVRNDSSILGQVVFALEAPTLGKPGYLAAAVRQRRVRWGEDPVRGKIVSEVVELPSPTHSSRFTDTDAHP